MIRHLVLCGLGPGHLQLLAHLAKQPARQHADIGISVLTRQRRYISNAALLKTLGSPRPTGDPDEVERADRQASLDAKALQDLAEKSGVRWISNTPRGLDLASKTLLLDDDRTLRFDWLSIEPEPVQNRDLIEPWLPGARANGLFVHPREAFCKLWPQVQALAATRPLRFALVLNLPPEPLAGGSPKTQAETVEAALATPREPGETTAAAESTLPLPLEASAPAPPPFESTLLPQKPATRDAADWALEKTALEMAFALRHAFKGSAVTLITGGAQAGQGLAPALQSCLQSALRKRHITVLREGASAIAPGEVTLQSGARLACDVPLLLLTPHLPDWLSQSGLALDERHQVQTDAALRSASHSFVFVNAQAPADNARRLLQGLRGVMAGRLAAAAALPNSHHQLGKNAVHRIHCGDGRAIVAWRQWAVESWRL